MSGGAGPTVLRRTAPTLERPFRLRSYFGHYGPLASPGLDFPWDVLVAAGIGGVAYTRGVRSGFETDEIRAIVEAEAAARRPNGRRPRPAG